MKGSPKIVSVLDMLENDAATRELLEDILEDEDAHVNAIEEKLVQVGQMGLALFLSKQT